MPSSTFPLVDVQEIIRRVGGAAFARGSGYAREDAVAELDWDAGSGDLFSRVHGTAAVPYRCHVRLVPTRGGGHRPESSSCSCPMSFDCKHVAATLLSSNTAHVLASSVRRSDSGMELDGPTDAGAGDTGGTDAVAEAAPDWQQSLSGLIGAGGGATGPAAGSASDSVSSHHRGAPTALGLQFTLAEPPVRARTPWRHPAPRERVPRSDLLRPAVRPVLRNSKGRWVKNTLRWNTIGYKTYGLNLDPEQHRWFSQFAPLHRANGLAYYGEDNDWLYLDEFSSPLLWQLFAEAQRLGIELVGAQKDFSVAVGQQATLSLDASAQKEGEKEGEAGADAEDGIILTPALHIDGGPHSLETAGPIGHHGIYSYTEGAGTRLILAPTGHKISEPESALLSRRAPLIIPGQDVPRFLEEYYPPLSRALAIASSDSSVSLPEILPPVLVLTATYGEAHKLELLWEWEYLHGQSAVHKPLNPAPEEREQRDTAAEAELLGTVRTVLNAPEVPASTTLQNFDAVEFTEHVLPKLEALEGVRVDIVGGRPDYRELTEVPELTVSTVETEQSDWFDLGVIVTVAGRKIPFNSIFRALTKGQKKLLLVDRSYLSLEQPIFDRLRELIDEALVLQDRDSSRTRGSHSAQPGTEFDGDLRISRYQAGLWGELEELAEETEQARTWRSSVTGLLELDSLEQVPVPEGLNASLRPYQLEGFNWLAFLWQHRLGGVLADDMGLGKTLQALALLCHRKEAAAPQPDAAQQPFLVVAPTSVVSNWVAEAHRFTPGLAVVGITDTQAKGRRPLTELIAGADVVITSYTLFRLDYAAYSKQSWGGLILDEAQFVKNRTARVHRCAKDLAVPFKLAITGTPMENNLMELHALFSIVAPGLFPASSKFAEQYQRPIERRQDAELLARLRRRIRPLMMRRTKEAVASDLPAKQEQILEVELGAKHQKIYSTYLQRERQKILRLVEDMDRHRFTIFQSLTLLRMLSLDASLVDPEYADVPSSKLDALFEQLEDVVAEGHRALIFSQFTSFLKKAAQRLDAAGIAYCYLDGSTRRRAEVIARFKDGAAPVFLISLKAGGFGLNLTEADYCFLLDPWWNPATEAQAVDRTHRIGQTKNVMVYRMVARNTIEEKVMALKERKAKLFSSVLDDDAMFSSTLTAADVRGLLEA